MSRDRDIRPSLRRPVASLEELEAVGRRVTRARAASERRVRFLAVTGLLLAVINLGTSASASELPPGERWWSLFPIASFALLGALGTFRSRILLGRILEADRRLLFHRGLLGREPEIAALERSLGERLAELGAAASPAREALEAASAEAGRLLQVLRGDASDVEAAVGQAPPTRVLAAVDAYRIALSNLDTNRLLQPDFNHPPELAQALVAARDLLIRSPEGGVEPSSRRPRNEYPALPR